MAFVMIKTRLYVSRFSNVWIPKSSSILERAADSVYYLSPMLTDVTSYCDFF